MKKRLLVFLVFILLTWIAYSTEEEDFFKSSNHTFFEGFLISHFPGGFGYLSFIENYAPDITLLIEENNGFALMDNPRVYFEGDSCVSFNWFLNGFSLNSSLYPGSPALIPPFSSISQYQLINEAPFSQEYGFNFLAEVHTRAVSKLTFSTSYTDLGSYSSWGTFMIHNHAANRDERLYTERRKIKDNFFLDYLFNKRFKNSSFIFSLNYFDIVRQFNDFNAFNETYLEEGELFLFLSQYKKFTSYGWWDLIGALNIKNRSNLNSELGRYPQETLEQRNYSFITGLNLKIRRTDIKLSFVYESDQTEPVKKNFNKDLIDNDGEGLFPYERMGEMIGRSVNLNINLPIKLYEKETKYIFNLFADGKFTTVSGTEIIHDHHTITFNQTPYLVMLWDRGESYTQTHYNVRFGCNVMVPLLHHLDLSGKIYYRHDFVNFNKGVNDFSKGSWGYDLGLTYFNSGLNVMLAYGRIPYSIGSDVSSFLETDRPSAAVYRWQDDNGDLTFQDGEQSHIFGYSGGKYHFIDQDIVIPFRKRILLSFSLPVFKTFVFNLKGMYKQIKSPFWVTHRGEYGFYEPEGDNNIFYYSKPYEDFYLTNADFDKNPFYAQFLLNLKGGKKERWYFSFSFLAHMGMGYTMFGNGPGANDIGLIHESMANPNSLINGFGRVDGDRGYMAKLYFGFYLFRNFYLAASFKYRDGNPFAFFEYLNKYEQWVIYYQTIKAEDEKGIKGGPREDYVSDVSFKLTYKFPLFGKEMRLALSLFNILDFGSELSEYVYSGGSRDAMELQIPRSIRFTISYHF